VSPPAGRCFLFPIPPLSFVFPLQTAEGERWVGVERKRASPPRSTPQVTPPSACAPHWRPYLALCPLAENGSSPWN
jgi:hypothetical protein